MKSISQKDEMLMTLSQEQIARATMASNVFMKEQDLGKDCTVILTGSLVTGNVQKNSDVDLIIVGGSDNKRWGESRINELALNYQIYPEIQLAVELAAHNTVLCSMISKSILLSGSQQTYDRFRSLAARSTEKATEPVPAERNFLMFKKLKNLLDDMEDVKDTDPASFALLRGSLVDCGLHIFSKQHRMVLTNIKNRLIQVREIDERFYKLVSALLMPSTDQIYKQAQSLCAYFSDWSRIEKGGDWMIEERVVPSRRELRSLQKVPHV